MKVLIDEHASDAEAMLRNLDSKSFPEVIVQLITLKKYFRYGNQCVGLPETKVLLMPTVCSTLIDFYLEILKLDVYPVLSFSFLHY